MENKPHVEFSSAAKAHLNIWLKPNHVHEDHNMAHSEKDCIKERSSISLAKTILAGRTKTECCAPQLMKHWRFLSAWNKHEPWWCTVALSVVFFQSVISFEELVAFSVGLRIIDLKFKFDLSGLNVFFLLIDVCKYYHSCTVSLLLGCCFDPFYSKPLLPLFHTAVISYPRCSLKVCRLHSLQSSWWGSCTEQWSVQRSLPLLQVWTGSWRQIPGNAGLGVWTHMDGTPGNLTTTRGGKRKNQKDKHLLDDIISLLH